MIGSLCYMCGYCYQAETSTGQERLIAYTSEWELSDSLHTGVTTAVSRPFRNSRPVILNSDQGSQFTSHPYIEMLKQGGVQISMNGKGRATDNAITERFVRTLKTEEVYVKEYQTPGEARIEITRYIESYNSERPHQSINDHTPAEMYYDPSLRGARVA